MMKALLSIGLLIVLQTISTAQEGWLAFPGDKDSSQAVKQELDFNKGGGSVEISKDPRIDKIDEFVKADAGTVEGVKMDGYRILIFFDQDKTVTQQQKAHFMSLYPEHKAYIDYLAPNYRVRVGNFRTKLEAEALKSELIGIFPTAIVIEDKIQLPELAPATE